MRNYNEKLRWEKASNIKRIFMHHPDSSRVVRYIAFFFFLYAVGPWIFLGVAYLFMGKETQMETGIYIYLILSSICNLFLSYGFSHLKRWSLYLFGALSIFGLLIIKDIERFYSLIGLIIVLFFYKKFH